MRIDPRVFEDAEQLTRERRPRERVEERGQIRRSVLRLRGSRRPRLERERIRPALPEPELVEDRDLVHREVAARRREVRDLRRQEDAARARGRQLTPYVRREIGEVV